MTGHPRTRDWGLDDGIIWGLGELQDTAERVGAMAVAVSYHPSEPAASAVLYGHAAASDLILAFRALADRLERGALRMPLEGVRWGDEQYEA